MKNFHAEGSFSNNNGINAVLTIPYIVYQGSTISGLKITANTSSNGLAIAGNIDHIKNGTFYEVYNTRLNADILNNNINFNLGIDDNKAKNKYLIAGLVSQPSSGTYTIKLKPDSLLLNYQKWTVSSDNLVTILPDNITANNFVLQNGDQRLSINSPADRGQQALEIGFSNFRLATITGFLKADSLLADGLINGNVDLNDFLQQPNIKGDITIDHLSIQKDTIGNVAIHASTSGVEKYNAEVTITGNGNDVALTGSLATAGNDMNLNLDLNVKSLQLHSLEGLMAGAIKNSSGSVNGHVSIGGSLNKPAINGNLNFNKSSFAVSLLGSQFNVDGQTLSVTNDGLAFNNFTVKDSSGKALTLNGNVLTSNFINYEFNLKLTARNFQLLNSTKKDNPVYYGRMTINADLSITGTEVKPVVDGRITVDDGTALTFVVPQSEEGIESRQGIVEFVNMRNPASDTLFRQYDSLNKATVVGMDISLNIEVKKEAIFNIVIDEANGDFLNAQGEAQLTAGIDPSGKITLTGNYTLEKGSYQITFNFLQRKFEIRKGSVIIWTGEPTTAQLDV
ncbi:MAG TPA: translocation/assembly module TamB domain-containing protein, partial [Chitinophagaceae bacterium]